MTIEAERAQERRERLGFVYRYVRRCRDTMTVTRDNVKALLMRGQEKGRPVDVVKSIAELRHLRELASHIDIYSVPPDFAVSVVVELRQAIDDVAGWADNALKNAPLAHSDGRSSIERAVTEIEKLLLTPEVILTFLEDHYRPEARA